MRSPTERFHAIDATRAFALLLGVVFHASWSLTGRPMTAAIVDVSSSLGFMWFFFAAHMFRMQLFFLIAGFFARLLYHQRGAKSFYQNRFWRIVVPLVIGWFIFSPIRSLVWTWGANRSGSNLTPIPLWEMLGQLFVQGRMFIEPSQGGLFSLIHLWFLYYLIWIYLLATVGRVLLLRIVPSEWRLEMKVDQVVSSIVRSPWSLGVLAVASGLCLWPMTTWFGVDTPTSTIRPQLPPLLAYGMFFMVGWLLHRQPSLLTDFQRQWKWRLATGLALSVVMFLGFGLATEFMRSIYRPNLAEAQITDWPRFLSILKSASTDHAVRPELKQFWARFPETSRTAIFQLPDTPDPNRRDGLCKAMTALLMAPDPFGIGTLEQPNDPALNLIRNRTTFDAVFEGVFAPDSRVSTKYWIAKLAYSIAYALTMWLLVFGTVGVFQRYFQSYSATWRYIADSSYWIYVVHLTLVSAIQVWIGLWPIPGLVKFALINATAFVVLFASYHYLVRSTMIGQLLNGRRYPFVAWPFARTVKFDQDASERPKLHGPPNPLAVPALSSVALASETSGD